jgi:glycosyltransferase involved in cell wall biosynthesis
MVAWIAHFDFRRRYAGMFAQLQAVSALRALGYDVRLVLHRPRGVTAAAMRAELEGVLADAGLPAGLPVVGIPVPEGVRGWMRWYATASVVWARWKGARLVWTREVLAADHATRLGIPTILEYHLQLSAAKARRVRRTLARPALRSFVVISEAHRRLLVEESGLPGEKMLVGHSAVDVEAFRAGDEPGRAALGLPEGPLVMYAGSLYRGRGVEELLGAAAERPGVSFAVVGGPDEEAERFRARSREAGLANVRFTGRIPQGEVPRYLRAADVLVLPHTAEATAVDGAALAGIASPLKLFEYMAAARPVVASGLGPVREVLEDGRTGVLVPPGDARALAEGIDAVLADPALARRLAEGARAEVEKYTWSARTRRILERAGIELPASGGGAR